MEEAIVRRLVEINATFYRQLAEPFAASRNAPQPGYERLLPHIPERPLAVLDVGCGNGRFGRYLARHRAITYTGVDFTPTLFTPIDGVISRFETRDLSNPESLAGLGQFDLVACLSTLQHIPGHRNRERLVREMAAHMSPGGLLLLVNWQFLDNARQRRKIVPWSEVGLESSQVEPGDHLLSWDRDGRGVRYASHIDEENTEKLVKAANLRIVTQFRADGREGNLNLYSLMAVDTPLANVTIKLE